MPLSLRHILPYLRLLALVVLALGLVAKPMLVAACELDDMRLAQSAVQDGTDAVGDPAEDECCLGQACGECCTATPVLPIAFAAGPAVPVAAHPRAAAWVESEPAPLPVAIRPPIDA